MTKRKARGAETEAPAQKAGALNPLFRHDQIAANPGALIVICQGQNEAEAASILLSGCVVVGGPTDGKTARGLDWSALKGREVLIWPNAGKLGDEFGHEVSGLVLKQPAKKVRMLCLDGFRELRGAGQPLPDGWGPVAASSEGLSSHDVAAVALHNPNSILCVRKGGEKKAKMATLQSDHSRFSVVPRGHDGPTRPGVYFRPQLKNKETAEVFDGEPEWICSPLHIEAETRNADGKDWGRLLCVVDRDGKEQRWAMPMAMLAGDGLEVRENLLSLGLEIEPDANKRRRLLEYLAKTDPGRKARCVAKAGWHGAAFVTPAGTYGSASDESLVLQAVSPGDHKLLTAGTLDDWRQSVSMLCPGNSRLVLAVSAAFAAPCLQLVGQEGGGFHLRGPSSCGKSTALAIASSVYGPPEYRREWRTSDNGLEGVAALHSDSLLPLDEIGQLDPQHAATAAYLLSNGQGKSRSRRDGSLRAPATWRLLFMSCGEVGLADLAAEAGKRYRAGMEVRVIDLPADAGRGLGLFDQVPGSDTPGRFADQIKAASARFHGSAFPAFMSRLVGDLERMQSFLLKATEQFTESLAGPGAAGQVRRVAARFALIAAAGELASSCGITGWQQGEAEQAVTRCFADWLKARGGSGESEPREMVRAVQAFIELHSDGRFPWLNRANDDHAPKTLNRAGWRVKVGEDVEHWVLPEVWRREVCKGFDPTEVARVLVARKLLKPEASGSFTRKERVSPKETVRVLRLLPGTLEHEP